MGGGRYWASNHYLRLPLTLPLPIHHTDVSEVLERNIVAFEIFLNRPKLMQERKIPTHAAPKGHIIYVSLRLLCNCLLLTYLLTT